jgi:DNA-binding Xre family transcriptional regulator
LIRFTLAQAMANHEIRMGRRVGWREVAEATGVHRTTLSKMLNPKGFNTTDNIGALCAYFGCRVEDLMVYVPDPGGAMPTHQVDDQASKNSASKV